VKNTKKTEKLSVAKYDPRFATSSSRRPEIKSSGGIAIHANQWWSCNTSKYSDNIRWSNSKYASITPQYPQRKMPENGSVMVPYSSNKWTNKINPQKY
jgi:hypothetical protein